MQDIYGLGIESSCDETGVALLKNGFQILADPLYSQIDLHRLYGGVVPELASRAHLEKIPLLLQEALSYLEYKQANEKQKISYVAVTVQPGLLGSLLVGFNTAMAVSFAHNIPVVPIHHLEAHLYAVQLNGHSLTYPALGLLLSGGNSLLYNILGLKKIQVIGDTLDDAAGEALDKAALLLGLPYPGGPHIEKLAHVFVNEQKEKGVSERTLRKQNPLPKILKDQGKEHFDFSFSGLKTALLYVLKNSEGKFSKQALAYYFQERFIEITVRNVDLALKKFGSKQVVAAGGVLANQTLRSRLSETIGERAQFLVPDRKYCTDNAAMVAALGYNYFMHGNFSPARKVHSGNAFVF